MKKFILFLSLILITTQLFSVNDTRYDAGLNLPFNERAGEVNPQSGNVTINCTDIELPGRAGFNFSFSRVWNLNRSNIFNMDINNLTGNNRLSSNTPESHYRMGVGWSNSIPYIHKDVNGTRSVTHLFFNGSSYQLDTGNIGIFNSSKSNILGYELLDKRIYAGLIGSVISYADFIGVKPGRSADLDSERSKYVLILKDNSKLYFRADGSLLMEQDPSGLNRIWYFYNDEDKLTTVVDSIGRNIDFNYDLHGNLSEIAWMVDIWEKDSAGNRVLDRNQVRSVKYGYECSVSDFTGKVDPVGVQNYNIPYKLVKVVNQIGEVTAYSYKSEEATFSFASNSWLNNVYLTLTSIKQNVHTTNDVEAYTAAKFYEYQVPSTGRFKRFFYSGFMEYYKVSRVYNHNRHKEILNEILYTYFDNGENNNSNEYSTRIEQGGLVHNYFYSVIDSPSLLNVLTRIETESKTRGYFSENRVFTYDNNKTKTLEQVYRGELIYSEKFSYDKKGNLREHINRDGLVINRDYDPVYGIPVKEYKTVIYRSEQDIYQREWILSDKGQVEKSILFIKDGDQTRPIVEESIVYDSYGNVVSVTNANNKTQTIVYDSLNNAFPVYTWQNVEIDSYTNGDYAANWKSQPDSTSLIRTEKRTVFNSDGSIYMEFDSVGYGTERFYDALGREIETVSPIDSDDTSWFNALVTDEIDVNSLSFRSFLAGRVDNPGTRISIDDKNAFVKTEADLDKALNKVLSTAVQSDGLGNPEEEITYGPSGVIRGVTSKVYDNQGRLIALTDPDAGTQYSQILIHGKRVKKYDKTWLIKYDDLGRQIKVGYPKTSHKTDNKFINYDDSNNRVTTVDPEKRTTTVRSSWSGNVEEVINYGFDPSSAIDARVYKYSFDSLGRKREFVDPKGDVTSYKYNERDQLISQTFGSTGSDILTYNDLGLLVKKRDRNGNRIITEYDAIDRPINISRFYGDGSLDEAVKLSYNNRGLLWRVEGNELTEYSEFDSKGALKKHSRYLKNSTLRTQSNSALPQIDDSYSFIYNYTDSGLLKSMTYPDGGVHSFDYENGSGHLKGIKEANQSFVSDLQYNKSGVVESMSWRNGVTQKWSFDNRKRVISLDISRGSGSIESLQYTLNSVGDVTDINSNSYTYNGFGEITNSKTLIPGSIDQLRLVEESFGSLNSNPVFASQVPFNVSSDLNSDNKVDGEDHYSAFLNDIRVGTFDNETFTYDKSGNRISLVQNGVTYLYEYGARNQLNSINSLNLTINYDYDNNGNTIKKSVITNSGADITDYKYDTLNRLVATTNTLGTANYYYDNAGNRFVKDINNNKTIYLRQGEIAVAMDIELKNASADFVVNRYVLSGDLIAGKVTTTNTSLNPEYSYYHLDHLNSTKVVTDSSANVVVKYEYRAFGEQLSRLNETNNETEDSAKYSYGGKELDPENSLYYFNARYYDATTGRFITVDPAQDGTNWYIYCANNPLNMIDPTGLFVLKDDNKMSGMVIQGDNLPQIVNFYNKKTGLNLSLSAVAKHNKISESDELKAGMKIRFPVERWIANEVLVIRGGGINVSGTGACIKTGEALVTFSSTSGAEMTVRYPVEITSEFGYYAEIIGKSTSKTKYSRLFPANISKEEVVKSFEGAFDTLGVTKGGLIFYSTAGWTHGVDSTGKFVDNDTNWQGKTVGFGWGIGTGVTFGSRSMYGKGQIIDE